MFFQYRSNSLIELSKVVSDKISISKSGDPFRNTWVVVQNKEVRQWLSLRVAEHSGISANLEFILPSELIWKMYREYKPETPSILPFDRLPLQWRIFELLKNTSEFELNSVTGLPYVSDENQLFHLSGQIADVFDLYQVYRPEMVQNWKKGKLCTNDKSEVWQLWLWKRLTDVEYPEISSRSDAFQELLGVVNELELPKEIFIFGLSHFSKPFADLINKVSVFLDVHLFTEDLSISENSLFTSQWADLSEQWGKLKSESLELITEESTTSKVKDSDSVFKKLTRKERVNELLQIHSCHNPKREVEVLKDQLLILLDSDHELKPDDILIMVPDISEYSDSIKSIFSFNEGEPSIPVYAPKSFINEHTLVLIELLELIASEFKVSSFVSFIELDIVSERFGFSEDDLSLIRKSIREQHIHHGLSIESSGYSLEKLLLALTSGYITEAEDFELLSGIAPAEKINGTDRYELISRLSACIEYLKLIRAELNGNRAPQYWIRLIKNWAEELIPGPKNQVIQSLDRLTETCEIANTTEKTGFDIIKIWVISQLNDNQATSSGFGHGVVLSSYIPYRNIPFKVTAILGLNENTFPRNPPRPSFDLINNNPQAGERITKKDDGLIFLEILNSTEDHLYLSYLGQDQHSENERLPSVFIQKLLEIINDTKSVIPTIKEKLHGFHIDYFQDPVSYSKSRKKLADLQSNKSKGTVQFMDNVPGDLPAFNGKEIELNDLLSFFVHPCKWFGLNRLNINLGFEENETADREVFKVSALDKYHFEEKLFEGLDKNIPIDQVRDFMVSKGLIPEGVPGITAFRSGLTSIEALYNSVSDKYSGEPLTEQIAVEVGGLEIRGTVQGLFNEHIVQWRTGSERATDLIRLWINHLFLKCSSETFKTSFLITKNKDSKIIISQFGYVENPHKLLQDLIHWYIEAHSSKEYLCFFPESSKAYIEADSDPKKDPISVASTKWEPSKSNFRADRDFYNSLIWRGEEPIKTPAFTKMAGEFWNPLFKALGDAD